MKGKTKGYIAPIIVTVLLILYFVVYFGFLISLIPGWFKWLFVVFPIAFAGVIIYVCIERIKEIRSGEEDDLSKY